MKQDIITASPASQSKQLERAANTMGSAASALDGTHPAYKDGEQE